MGDVIKYTGGGAMGMSEDVARDGASGARLDAFEAFAREARQELAETTARMEALRDENKVKTATYRQLFAARITLKEIDRRLAEHGL